MRDIVLLSLLLAPVLTGTAHAAGDPVLGKRQFASCTGCHTVEAGGLNKIGPNLHGVVGRRAGSKDDYTYSKAVRNADIVWDEQQLDKYLTKPQEFLPGNKMPFVGVGRPDVRANIIAYLKDAGRR